MRTVGVLYAFAICGWCTPVLAQYSTTAEVESPLAANNDVDPTASGSAVDLTDRHTAGQTVQDVLPEVPGLQVSAFGSENAFVGVSLRGSELNHADVFVGDIPLGSIDGNAIDLGLLPLGAFSQIQIFRGGAPLAFGSSAIGGVVRFMPREGLSNGFAVSARAGSFETWELRARGHAHTRKASVIASAGVLGSRGNFTFQHDNGTRFVTDDDFDARRDNNSGRRGDGLLYLTTDTEAGQVSVLFLGLGRARGEPGPAVDAAQFPTLHQSLYLGALSWTNDFAINGARFIRLTATVSLSRERTRFTDPLREIGIVGETTDNRRNQFQARLLASVDATPWLEITWLNRVIQEGFNPNDLTQDVGERPSVRTTFTTGIEARFHGTAGGWRWELRPSVQAHFSDARTENLNPDQSGFNQKRGWFPSGRVGVGLGPTPWLSFVGSGYRGLRLPSASELFGGMGLIKPSPGLDPERAWGLDAGVIIKGRRNRDERTVVSGLLDLRYFNQWYDDFIQLQVDSQGKFRAENLISGTSRGLEALGRVDLVEHVGLLGSLTINDTADPFGRWIPRKPRVLGRGRITLHSGPKSTLDDLAVFFETTHVGHRFDDRSNFVRVASQTWLGTGVHVTAIDKSLILALTLQDLLNRGGSTFLGYPLPGRRLSASIEYRKEL